MIISDSKVNAKRCEERFTIEVFSISKEKLIKLLSCFSSKISLNRYFGKIDVDVLKVISYPTAIPYHYQKQTSDQASLARSCASICQPYFKIFKLRGSRVCPWLVSGLSRQSRVLRATSLCDEPSWSENRGRIDYILLQMIRCHKEFLKNTRVFAQN